MQNRLHQLTELVISLENMSSGEILAQLNKSKGKTDPLVARWAREWSVARLGEIEPLTGLGYVASRPAEERAELQGTLFQAWAGKDPSAASAYVAQHLDEFGLLSATQGQATAAVAAGWATTDPEAAFRWAQSLPEELRVDAEREALAQMRQPPTELMFQTINNSDSLEERQELLRHLVGSLASRDPSGIAQWVNQVGRSEDGVTTAATLSSIWAEHDPQAASDWVRSLPSGPRQDAALQAMLDSPIYRAHPETSLAWAQSISDAGVRAQVIQRVLARWEILDPEGAASFQSAPANPGASDTAEK